MTDYDSPWKDVLERYFAAFTAFFFPEVHAGVDWDRGYEFLDKELQKVVRDAELGRRYADKLVKVWRWDGGEVWVLAHVEVQGQLRSEFRRTDVHLLQPVAGSLSAAGGQSGGAGGRTAVLAAGGVPARPVGL